MLSAPSCRCKHLFLVTNDVTGFVRCGFHIVGGQRFGKTSPRPTPTHFLEARASVHEDGGRDHDALHVHFTLCDTGFNSSWNLRTRRCEIIQIGDRGYVTEIASSKSMRNPVLGDREFGYPDNVSNQTESMCVSTLETIRCSCREGKSTKYQGFKYLDVTGLARYPMDAYVESYAPSL